MTRYARQQILPEVGALGQDRLRNADVLVVGAGGLGSPVLQYLAGAGVGRITLVDPDTVSLSNLHRQTLFRQDQLGQPKAKMAADAMRALNPDCTVTALTTALTPANAPGLVMAADLVLDCADSFAVSYILSDACFDQNKPLITASALGFQGYVGGFCGGAPSLRALFPDLPNRAATCATAGVLGPVVGTLGAMQAQMALSVLLGVSPSPLGQMLSLDLQNFRVGDFRFEGTGEPAQMLRFIDPTAIQSEDFVVDLRGVEEAEIAITPTAHRLSLVDFDHPPANPLPNEAPSNPPLNPQSVPQRGTNLQPESNASPSPHKGQRVILTCRSGLRAWQAARKMQSYWSGDIFLVALGDFDEPKKDLN